jgi:hypothetical protein
VPFFEAKFGDRLEHLLELPRGKVLASVEHMDAIKAREILDGHTCIMIRGPHSSKIWSVRQVEQYTKELIDKCRRAGKSGGLILAIRMPDRGTKEEYQQMLDRIREYGRY